MGKPVIWLHAVSVGEVLAVSRLVEETRTGVSGLSAADFDDDADRAGAGAGAVWGGAGLLLPAGSAVGGAGVFEGAEAGRCWCWRRRSSGRIC